MRIGEVARRSGVSARMLRHYDALGLVCPGGRTSAGYREYTSTDMTRLFHVESLRSLGLSLREVGRALDDPDFAPAALVVELSGRSAERIRREQALRDRLEHIDATAPENWEQVLEATALLAALSSPDAGRRQQAALIADDRTAAPAALVESLLRESDPNVAGALRWAVSRSDADGAALLAAAVRDPDVGRRRRAVLALIDLPAASSTAPLVEALADADGEVRARAALELADRVTTGPAVDAEANPVATLLGVLIDLVVEGVRDVDAGDALAAVSAATDSGDAVAARLSAALADASPDQRCRVAQALGEVPGEVAHEALTRLTSDPDEQVARTAAYLLSRHR